MQTRPLICWMWLFIDQRSASVADFLVLLILWSNCVWVLPQLCIVWTCACHIPSTLANSVRSVRATPELHNALCHVLLAKLSVYSILEFLAIISILHVQYMYKAAFCRPYCLWSLHMKFKFRFLLMRNCEETCCGLEGGYCVINSWASFFSSILQNTRLGHNDFAGDAIIVMCCH